MRLQRRGTQTPQTVSTATQGQPRSHVSGASHWQVSLLSTSNSTNFSILSLFGFKIVNRMRFKMKNYKCWPRKNDFLLKKVKLLLYKSNTPCLFSSFRKSSCSSVSGLSLQGLLADPLVLVLLVLLRLRL